MDLPGKSRRGYGLSETLISYNFELIKHEIGVFRVMLGYNSSMYSQ